MGQDFDVTMKVPRSEADVVTNLRAKETKGLLGRHVAWVREPRKGAKDVGVSLLAIGEIALMIVSVVGIVPLVKAISISKKLKEYDQKVQDVRAVKPPDKSGVMYKSPTRTFNHINEFAISDGKLWYRPKVKEGESPKEWKLFYYNQKGPEDAPMEIKADGANLMVKAKSGEIHYKKVLKESYDKKGNYSCKDVTEKNNWYSAWFSFPVFRQLYHLVISKKIVIPEDAVAWGMSHRGKYAHHYDDVENREHAAFPMVTTLYILLKGGKEFAYSDPFVVLKFGRKFKGPPGNFVGTNFCVSASTVLVIGKNGDKLELHTRLADYDTMGKNIFLPSFWKKGARANPEWQKQADLPLEKGDVVHEDSLTIYQTGRGNKERVLVVPVRKADGTEGYYQMKIDSASWGAFHPHPR